MNRRLFVVACLVLLAGAMVIAAETTPSVLWSVTFNSDYDFAFGVAAGPDGHPVVAGYTCVTGTGHCDVRTIKYDSTTGAVLWNVTFDSGANSNDTGFALDVGSDGHPVVVGHTCDATSGLSCVARIIKYDATNGAVLWNVTYSPSVEDVAEAVAIGPDGHPVVSIGSCDANFANCVRRTMKLDGANGAILWSVVYSSGPGRDDYPGPRGIDVGADGDAVVTGQSCDAAFTACDVTTIKYDGTDGSIIWNVTFDSGGSDYGAGLSIGPDGHAVVNGDSTFPGTGGDIRTMKLDGATGATLWNVVYNSGGQNEDFGRGVEVGTDGHPVVGGSSCTPSYPNCDFRTMKLDGATGATMWNVTVAGADDFALGLAVGVDGNPVVTGGTCAPGGGPCDFLTIKYLIQQATPAGMNVAVELNGGAGVADGIGVSYSVVALPGSTTLTTDTDGPPPPAGFGFVGTPPTYYNLATSAVPAGSIEVCINYSTRPFAEPESGLKLMHFELGSWVDVTTSLDTVANVICGSVTSLSPFAIAQAGKVLTSLGPASIWVGLTNSDDVGIRFDLRAEVYRNGDQRVGSGQLASVQGGSSGFNNARLDVIPLASQGQVAFPPGSTLSIRLLVRNACTGSGKSSGSARLWFNDAAANSRFDATLDTPATYYLRSGFTLDSTPGSGPRARIDVAAGQKCSPYKSFGTWTTTVP